MLDDAVPIPPPFLKNIKKILRVVKLHMFKFFKKNNHVLLLDSLSHG